MAKPTDPLLDLMFQALDNAVESITNSNGPLIPFAIMASSAGERNLVRFTTGKNPDEARQHARSHVTKEADCVRYAIGSDGSITENGQRVPVVMVEAVLSGPPGRIPCRRGGSDSLPGWVTLRAGQQWMRDWFGVQFLLRDFYAIKCYAIYMT